MEDGNWIKLAIVVVALLASVVGSFLERARRKRAHREGEEPPPETPKQPESAPEEEEPEAKGAEPMLPYEDLVEEVFGPYMARRRREYLEKKAREALETAQKAPVEPTPPPEARPTEERRPEPVREPVAAPAPKLAATLFPETLPSIRRRTLEERILANRRWSPAARLWVASELFHRPKFYQMLSGRILPWRSTWF